MHCLSLLLSNASGDTTQWTGCITQSNFNPAAINDAKNITDNTSGDICEWKGNGLPAGTFSVKAVKVIARAIKGTSGENQIAVGVKTNLSTTFCIAATLNLYWSTQECFYPTNPITASPWIATDITNLQGAVKTLP